MSQLSPSLLLVSVTVRAALKLDDPVDVCVWPVAAPSHTATHLAYLTVHSHVAVVCALQPLSRLRQLLLLVASHLLAPIFGRLSGDGSAGGGGEPAFREQSRTNRDHKGT